MFYKILLFVCVNNEEIKTVETQADKALCLGPCDVIVTVRAI